MSEALGATQTSRVLVVDDDPVIRLLVCGALSAIGITPVEAENGHEALAIIERNPPDLMILDVELPGRDGLEICAELRERPDGRDLPVLILTGSDDSDVIDRAFRVGATDFIGKPVDLQLLQHRVPFLMRAQGAFSALRRTHSVLRDSEARLANAQRLAQIGNWEWVPGEDDMLWSDQVHRIFGVQQGPGSSTLAAFLGAAHPEDREELRKAMMSAGTESTPWSLEHRIVPDEGEERIVRQQTEITAGPAGEAYRITGTIQDITDRRRAEEKIQRLANYDELTALPNRKMLSEMLDRVLRGAEDSDEMIGLLFLDLDRFKRVNDAMGHQFGDSVIKAVSDRLFECVRLTDYVGRPQPPNATSLSRLGGDEFAVLLKGLHSAKEASHVARRILEALRAPFWLDGERVDLSGTLGIALYPSDGNDSESLLRKAGAALDQAKTVGRDVYQFFDVSMNEKAVRNMQLETQLRVGIGGGELTLHYQPQIDVNTGRIVSVEALVRWLSQDHGLVSPADFIPLAEDSGLIIELGEWVLRTACHQNQAWIDAGIPPLRIAVNVSSHQLRKGDFAQTVERALHDSRLSPELLEVEITESTLIGNEPGVIETLERLREMGVRLALDDFGTGYSSLSHLVEFPINTLKIDQSFVREIGINPQADAITAAVVAMGHNLELDVTAEGVETAQQEEFLRERGCDTFQGFLFSKPIEADDLEALLRHRKTP
jgi:diguanylate cyclase (GGDEF)-like protein/PAS domain S-box-containing protein